MIGAQNRASTKAGNANETAGESIDATKQILEVLPFF